METDQRYQMREQVSEPKRRWLIIDTWTGKIVDSSLYSSEAIRKLYRIRDRIGNGHVYKPYK